MVFFQGRIHKSRKYIGIFLQNKSKHMLQIFVSQEGPVSLQGRFKPKMYSNIMKGNHMGGPLQGNHSILPQQARSLTH
jgi:hypothetical protein